MIRLLNYSIIFISVFLFACSSAKESIQQNEKKEPEIYVFDDVTKIDTVKTDTAKINTAKTDSAKVEKIDKPKEVQPTTGVVEQKTEQQVTKRFIVQVGAFTTEERAQAFVNENQSKTNYQMNIVLKEQLKLYVVQLPPFTSREEAEKVRNNLWKISAFKGAFILTTD